MKLFAKTLIAMSLTFSCAASYSQTLTVWEDEGKSLGIESAVRDFKSMYGVDVAVKEKSSVQHLNEVRTLRNEGGEMPDVFIMISDRVGDALTDNLISPLSFMNSDRSKYAEAAVAPFTVNHQIYASPRSIETLVIYYNKDVMDYPFENFDDYVSFARQRQTQNAYGLVAKLDNFYFAYGLLSGFGGYVFGINADGTFNPDDVGLNSDGTVRGLNELANYANSYLPPVLLTDEGWSEMDRMFISGKAAAVMTGPWALEPYSKAGVNYGLAPLPKLSNGSYIKPFYGVKGYVVSSECKDKALAEKFIAFINQPKYALDRYSKIAELPPVTAVMENPLIVNDDFANAVAQQIQHADPMPSIPQMGRVWGAMADALNSVIKDKADAKVCLDKAAAAVLGKAPAKDAVDENVLQDEDVLLAEEGLLDDSSNVSDNSEQGTQQPDEESEKGDTDSQSDLNENSDTADDTSSDDNQAEQASE